MGNSESYVDSKGTLHAAHMTSVWTKFKKAKQLGSGTYGIVFSAAEEVAVKMIEKSPDKETKALQKADYKREASILLAIQDLPNVVRYKGIVSDHKYYCIITELCKGGELWDYFLKHSEDSNVEFLASQALLQILIAVAALHSIGIVHLDLKPENVLLAEPDDLGSLKIVDFGSAQYAFKGDEPLTHTEFGGTLLFAAPEILPQFASVKGNDLFSIDMWSIGAMTFQMVTGVPAFANRKAGETESIIRQNIYKCSYAYPEDITVSAVCKDFISKLLVLDPKARMNAQEALAHPFISKPDENRRTIGYDPFIKAGFQAYQKRSKLRKLVVFLLAKIMTEKETEKINDLFQSFDTDKSGVLEFTEVRQLLESIYGLSPKDAEYEAKQVIEHSPDHTTMKLEDFYEFVISGSLSIDASRIRHAFNCIDKDASGTISQEELIKTMEDLKGRRITRMTEENIIEVLKSVDVNGDGTISFEEFEKGIRESAPP